MAELAAELGEPIDVLGVRLGKLIAAGQIHVTRPVQADELPAQPVLRDVLDRLRSI